MRILWFSECCLFPDHLGAVTLEDLRTMLTESPVKSLNSSSGRICFQQSYATSQKNHKLSHKPSLLKHFCDRDKSAQRTL